MYFYTSERQGKYYGKITPYPGEFFAADQGKQAAKNRTFLPSSGDGADQTHDLREQK